ncbi:MAG: hypothetical protein U9O64_11060 [Campylobacterota bacterium]|nr:hypothetical protein [Campylobacterota bacterium]
MAEWLHSSKTYKSSEILLTQNSTLSNNRHLSSDYLGLSAYYDFNLLINGALSTIYSVDDQSSFISPLVEYSLGDDASLALGALLYTGSAQSEFGSIEENSYYLRWKMTF